MLINMGIDKFIDETASNSPAPGGGSVSALAGALGAALSSMVGELTLVKETDDKKKKNVEELTSKCKKLIESLKQGVDKDTEVFNTVMAAYKMPKASDDEKKVRSQAIQNALKAATSLPYETALLCLDVMKMAKDMLNAGTKNAASDAAVSGFLGYAGLNGALYNVKININTIKDEKFAGEMKNNVEALVSESEKLLSEIKSISKQLIG